MPRLKPWTKASRGRRINIKRVILFAVIVYVAYVFINRLMPVFMFGFLVWLLYNWTGKRRFW